jgi:hypothetical protein
MKPVASTSAMTSLYHIIPKDPNSHFYRHKILQSYLGLFIVTTALRLHDINNQTMDRGGSVFVITKVLKEIKKICSK